MFCKTCGKEINDKAVVCVHCGCSVTEQKKEPDKKKKKKLSLIVFAIVFLFVFIVAVGSSDTEPTDETSNANKTSAVTTTKPAEFSDECPVSVSASIVESVIGTAELKCNIRNNTDKAIAAIKFHFEPLDVYGEEVNNIITTTRPSTDDRIGAGASVTRVWELFDQTVKSGTLYVYSVYFEDGTEWGDKEASTSAIRKYCEKINVEE